MIGWRFPAFHLDPSTPLNIIAARDEDTARALLPNLWKQPGVKPAGVFFRNWERNCALVRLDTWSSGAREVVYHEYTHTLLHLNALWLPMWLDEGMAEFFAFTRFEHDRMLLGAPSGRWATLEHRPLLPVSVMLGPPKANMWRDDTDVQVFYAESWALVHFMTFGPGMQNGKLLSDFFDRLQHNNSDQRAAFTATFGDLSAFDSKFEKYIHTFLLNAGVAPLPPTIEKGSFSIRALPFAEALYEQALFHVSTDDRAGARALLTRAEALDPKLAGPYEELGFLDFYGGEDSKAQADWQTALTLNPESFRSRFALIMTRPSLRAQTPEQRSETIADLQKVIHTDLRFAPAYTQLAKAFWWQGRLDAALRASRQAEVLEPWRPGYHLLTAKILLAQNKGREAATLAHRTADLYTGTDRSEAIALLRDIPAADRGSLTPGDDKIDGTEQRLGTLTDVSCSNTSVPNRLVILPRSVDASTSGGHAGPVAALTLTLPERYSVGHTDTLWIGGGRFAICHHDVDHPVLVTYRPRGADRGELAWIDVLDDLPEKSAAPKETVASSTP